MACILHDAPKGIDLTCVPQRRLRALKANVRVQMQLGSFPEVVELDLGGTPVRVVASINGRDAVSVELTVAAIDAIRTMVQASHCSLPQHPNATMPQHTARCSALPAPTV